MTPKIEQAPESGPSVQNEDFERSPDMVALDIFTREIIGIKPAIIQTVENIDPVKMDLVS